MAGRKKKVIAAGCKSAGKKAHENEPAAEIAEYLSSYALAEDVEEQQEKAKCLALLAIDTMSIELGIELKFLLDPEYGANLKKQCDTVRRHIESETGIAMPEVMFRDNYRLKPDAYSIKIREIEAAQGELIGGHMLAIGPKEKLIRLPAEVTTHRQYGAPGKWITKELSSRAERLGCVIIDPENIIAGHLGDVCRSHAAEFLGYQEVHALLERCRKKHPEAVKRVYPTLLPLCTIRKILQGLVRESVSIRALAAILNTLARYAGKTQNVEKLTEYARTALSRDICSEYANSRGEIYAIVLDQDTENTLSSLQREEDGETFIDENTDEVRSIMTSLGEKAAICSNKMSLPIIVCSPAIRPALWKLGAKSHPGIVVLSRDEIAPDTTVIEWLVEKEDLAAGAPASDVRLEKWPAASTEVIEWLKKEEEKETLAAVVFDIRLEKWLASFVVYDGEKYDIKLGEYACEILIKAIAEGIEALEGSVGSIPIFLSSIMYYVINSSEGGSRLRGTLQERFPTLRLSYRDERSSFKTLYRNVINISVNEEMLGYHPKPTAQLDEWLTQIEDKKAVIALTTDIQLEKWLASFVFYNGVRYDIRLDAEAEETFINAIEKGIDMIESEEDSIPIFTSSILYYIIYGSEGGFKLNKKIQERFPRVFFSYRDGHSFFNTFISSMGKLSIDTEPSVHKPDAAASS
ncbi:MAG: FHIPEP family type III secretion protein [Candidatus Xenobiia bacterium LiM19]